MTGVSYDSMVISFILKNFSSSNLVLVTMAVVTISSNLTSFCTFALCNLFKYIGACFLYPHV